jgi:hypothetical protein
MATVHISVEEAEKDLRGLIARSRNGDEILIEENSRTVAVLRSPIEPRLLSETLRILDERGSNVTLDGEFEKDVLEFIHSHREPLRDIWD